jgi:hypothetical protein
MNVRTQVQCHKVRGEEVPSGFRMGTEFLHVRRVIGSWEKDDIRYFKVATLDGRVFLLGLDTFTGRWELERRATSNPDGEKAPQSRSPKGARPGESTLSWTRLRNEVQRSEDCEYPSSA